MWACWRKIDMKLDGYAALRPTETAVVVLDPRTVAGACYPGGLTQSLVPAAARYRPGAWPTVRLNARANANSES
jgi:hypothetical protein